MRRRKVLVGIGALSAGGAAAFGTEAFSSVEATRTVDVDVASDAEAYLALDATNSENAADHVGTETTSAGNDIIKLEFSSDDSTAGSGVNDEALTKFDDLFKVVNKGSQSTHVYITDQADWVTFRSDGSSIEGPSNAVEVAPGEEIIVSLTIDTTGGQSDYSAETATIFGDSQDPSGSGPVAEFNKVVDSGASGGGPTTYSSIQAAVNAASKNDNIGIKEATYNEAVQISKDGLTLQSIGSVSSTTLKPSAPNDNNKAIRINGASNITIDGLTVTFNGDDSPNGEKYAIRARAGSDNLVVRNSIIENIETSDDDANTGATRATGITVTDAQGSNSGQGTAGPEIVNNIIKNIRCTGETDSDDTDSDSKAKGVALNGDVSGARIVDNTIKDIGTTSNDPTGAQNSVDTNDAVGTAKPRGIGLTEAGDGDGPTAFEIVRNDIDGIAGTYGQPAIFMGGSTNLGSSHVIRSNNFRHPVDSLASGQKLLLEENWWSTGNPPDLKDADTDATGGALIDRGTSDTRDSYQLTNTRDNKVPNAGSTL